MSLYKITNIVESDDPAELLRQLHPLARWVKFAKSDSIDWFRGEPAVYPSCCPQIDRSITVRNLPLSDRLEYERDLMRRFVEVAAGRLTHFEHTLMLPGDNQSLPLDLQIVMRHRAIPTRLLDWTMSPLVALYFACLQDPGRPDDDGRLLWFDRKRAWVNWNTAAGQVEQLEHDVIVGGKLCPAYLHDETVSNYEPWATPYFLTSQDYPTLYPRVREQRGVFTVAGIPGLDHWEQICEQVRSIGDPERPGAGVIRVPSGSKRLIRDVLAQNWNISANTLFPDPEGVVLELSVFSGDYLHQSGRVAPSSNTNS